MDDSISDFEDILEDKNMLKKFDLPHLQTERRNPYTMNIDEVSTLEMCKLINDADRKVPKAVGEILPKIANVVDIIAERINAGGRLFYIGAGTSGRLGILDAVECPPTFSTDPQLVQGIIAGGIPAIFKAQEGAEDSLTLAEDELRERNFSSKDVLMGIAASGRTPYVIGAIRYAKKIGATTIALACTNHSEIGQIADYKLECITEAEVITGSTRMKAGSAQKMILNMISTAVMIKLGKTYGNLMVDVRATNYKLEERAKRIIMEATNVDYNKAQEMLRKADGIVKIAIVMFLLNVDKETAQDLIDKNNGKISKILV